MIFPILLLCALTFLNGFTDAPNSIATAVATNALSMKRACVLSAVCNLAGLCMSLFIGMPIARAIFEVADLTSDPVPAVSASLLAVISVSILAWIFAMPSSESHALVASIAGVSLAVTGKINLIPFVKIIVYMLLSCLFSALASYIILKAIRKKRLPYKRLQILACSATSLAHGAQDGQKLVGVMLFLVGSGQRQTLQACVCVAFFLFVGTVAGGGKITEMMGNGICRLNEKSALASDTCATLCLILCSIFGFAVSTSNVKACSILGAGLADGVIVNYKSVAKIVLVALATVPASIMLSVLYFRLFS